MEPNDSKSAAAFASVKPWIRADLVKLGHRYESGEATVIRRDGGRENHFGCKCLDPAAGIAYFYFHESAGLAPGELIRWRGHEDWFVLGASCIQGAVRCDIRAALPIDADLNDLLMSAGLEQAANYLRRAESRIMEGTQEAFAECKTHCRSALQSAVESVTGVSGFKNGISSLRSCLQIGSTDTDLIRAVETTVGKLLDELSKSGPHPPLPLLPPTVWGLEMTRATLRFIAATRKK